MGALGVEVAPPSLALLTALHRAFAARFSHDTVWMVRDRVPPLTVDAMVESLLSGEGGACMQLNVTMHWLLRELGYDVSLHSATAQSTFQLEASRHLGDHCVLTVRLPEGTWLVDVGTGTGHSDPLPLREGDYVQGGFSYRVLRTPCGMWRIEHDRRTRALRAVEFTLDVVGLSTFEELYLHLATDPESPYRLAPWAQRRTADSVEMLHLRTLRIRRAGAWTVRHLETVEEWEQEMRERFHLGLPGLTDAERARIWAITGEVCPQTVSTAASGGAGTRP